MQLNPSLNYSELFLLAYDSFYILMICKHLLLFRQRLYHTILGRASTKLVNYLFVFTNSHIATLILQ